MWESLGRRTAVTGGSPGDSHTLSKVLHGLAVIAQPRMESFQADLLTGILPTMPEDAEFSWKQLSYLHSKVSVIQRLLLQIAKEKGKKICAVSTEY